ncbi:MAG: DUF3090 family protein [Nitriliruptoraceae bacterium]
MRDLELPSVHHVTIGYTGTPGERTFFFQVEDDDHRITLALEKRQAVGIADLLTQLLVRLDDDAATDWDRDAMALRPPLDPDWRIGEIAVGVDPQTQQFLIELTEISDEETDDVAGLRVFIDRDQARRLAAQAREQASQGRPRCTLCGRPTSAAGDHVCPMTNGHGDLS